MDRRSLLKLTPLLALPRPLFGQSSAVPPLQSPAKQDPPKITAASAILADYATGRILFEKDASEKRQVASTQKLLTALLICESGNLERMCDVVEAESKVEPSKMFIKPGQTYPRLELLKALLLKSANDCAMCLARNHAGSEEAFAELMNRRAAQLGMKNSKFRNASGLPAEQYSTAYDMAALARTAIQQRQIQTLVATKRATFNHFDGKPRILHNTNELLTVSPYCHGMKTGFTNAAGKCLVSCASHRGRTVLAVMLGSTTKAIWKESKALLHFGLGVE